MTPYREKNKNGELVWRVAYRVAGRRVRQSFSSRAKADKWIKFHRNVGRVEGEAFQKLWLAINDRERHELMDALSLIRAHRIKHPKSKLVLAKAVAEKIAVVEEIQASVSLRVAVDLYLASKTGSKRKGSICDGWMNVLDLCLRRVVRELPDKTLPEFSTEEIEEYLDDQDWAARSFNNYYAYLFGLFKWAIQKGYATENPIAKIEKFAKKFITREVIVPAVPTVGALLKLAQEKRHSHLKPALAFGFGLAFRSSEISKMRWENVTSDLVHVPDSVGKGGRGRNIARRPLLNGVFKSLMVQKLNQTGLIMPKGWRRDLTRLFEEAGLGKPRNMMRKSGGSYHYHATGDEAQTQDMMGHSEDSNIFRSAYKALNFADAGKKTPISKKDGLAYYRLWK